MAFCEKVRSFGYRVYPNKPGSCGNYAIVTDGINVGRMGEAQYNQKAVVFSTVHVPQRSCGSGFSCEGKPIDDGVTLDALQKKHVMESFSAYPAWVTAFHTNGNTIEKYKDFEDWKKRSIYSDQYDYESRY